MNWLDIANQEPAVNQEIFIPIGIQNVKVRYLGGRRFEKPRYSNAPLNIRNARITFWKPVLQRDEPSDPGRQA